MHILATVDQRYLQPLGVMMRSLLAAHPGQRVCLYVIHSSLAPGQLAGLGRQIGPRCEVADCRVDSSFLEGAPVFERFPKEMYYRIFAAQLLPEGLERVLYLDPDIVVLGGLQELYGMEMGSHFFAAAPNFNPATRMLHQKRLGMPPGQRYFNSGVLLMNLKALRQRQQPQEVFCFLEKHAPLLLLPDQDLLNLLYNQETLLVDPVRYNFDARYFPAMRAGALGQLHPGWLESRVRILHFCGRHKPWQPGYRGPLGAYYRRAAALPPQGGSCSGVQVGPVGREDLPQLLALYTHLHEASIPPEGPRLEAVWSRIQQSPGYHLLGAWADGRLAATVTVLLVPNLTRGLRPYALVENLVTHPDYRRRGLAGALLEEARRLARRDGCYKMLLATGSRDPGVWALYEKAGYNRQDKTAFVQWLDFEK